MEPGEPPDGVAWGEVWGRVTARVGIMGSVPIDLGESSVSWLGEELPGPLMADVS